MADASELLPEDPVDRSRRVVAVGAGLLLVLGVAAAAARTAAPPPPLEVQVAGLTGSALDGESFVRLHLALRLRGAQELGDAELTVGGTTQRRLRTAAAERIEARDDARLQFDVTPACEQVLAGATSGRLVLLVHDTNGDRRHVEVAVPSDGALERLLRHRCRTPVSG